MKLNEITDIEVLREELKNTMTEIYKTFELQGSTFNQGEYYHIEQDSESVYLFTDEGTLVALSYDEANLYLNKPKNT